MALLIEIELNGMVIENEILHAYTYSTYSIHHKYILYVQRTAVFNTHNEFYFSWEDFWNLGGRMTRAV